MKQNQSHQKNKTRNSIIILLSIVGLVACIVVLLPQVRQMLLNLVVHILDREPYSYQVWLKTLQSYAIGGICLILFLDYCLLTKSGKLLVHNLKQEINESLAEIDFKIFIKPVLFMLIVYLLGILTIIRANFSYNDDIDWAIFGYRDWHNWSRYVTVLLSYFVQPEIRMTDISPIPQLLAILILSFSSVLLVYILCKGKITKIRLLASIPLGLSPYFLSCMSYKFMASYMALPILASIVPFLFVARKKAFIFCSIVSLLIICMTYQTVSSIYLMIAVILGFQYWNESKKTNKEVLSFLGIAAITFCFALLVFKIFLMKPVDSIDYYTSTEMHPLNHMISGIIDNLQVYARLINSDLGIIWKIGIALVCIFFIFKSISKSCRGKILSSFMALLAIGISFILSYGLYLLLVEPLFEPRAMIGFGVFLAVICVYVVSDYKKSATIIVLALNWCLFVFAFSYGNALADQSRYAEFRINLLLHDLSALYPDQHKAVAIKFQNSIDYAPSIRNISRQYPVIERLVPRRLGATVNNFWDYIYLQDSYNYYPMKMGNNSSIDTSIDFKTLDLPVVLDSYYHTIKSDGDRILIILNH